MLSHHWHTFVELIRTPFLHQALVWGIVPLYFGLLLNELTADKATYRTSLQTGFSFLWAGAQWLWPYYRPHGLVKPEFALGSLAPVNLIVTLLVITLGLVALISGLRKKFPGHLRFIGHTRFANYFMIVIFPIQAHYLSWNWERLLVIVIFAVPIWLALHFGLMPLRGR
jgi:hypothetical protein